MASITKKVTAKGEARYRVFIRLKGANPVTKVFRDKKTATTWAGKVESEHEITGVMPDMSSHRHTLRTLIDAYQEDARDQDSSTIQRLDWWRTNYGQLTLNRLTAKTIKEALRELAKCGPKDQPISGSTCNRYHAAISAALPWAVSEGWLKTNLQAGSAASRKRLTHGSPSGWRPPRTGPRTPSGCLCRV